MKICIGVCIIIILIIASCGCTIRQANTTTTLPATTEPVQTPAQTPPETTAVPAPSEPVPGTTVPVTSTQAPNITTSVTTRPAMPPQTRVTTVHIRNNTFVPDQLTVLPGTRVTWVNDDAVTHIIKSTGSAAGKFTSAELINGAEFGYTFGEATGTFEFTDPSHPEMKGAIIIRTGQTLWVATFAPTTTSA